uniref:Uncharacterized protein n=1 Tax=viral metagenome TaxID=1070528 RepID=A0A6C0E8X1_9ZZZZ
MVSVDLKTIWVLFILLFVIILLSSIKVKTSPSKNIYKEYFDTLDVSNVKEFEDIIKRKGTNTLNQHVYLMKQAKEINELEQNIKNVEALVSSISQ